MKKKKPQSRRGRQPGKRKRAKPTLTGGRSPAGLVISREPGWDLEDSEPNANDYAPDDPGDFFEDKPKIA
jgi:hypothetical protein